MVTVNITVGEKPQSIDLGTRLENEARLIVFDVSYLIKTYGQGTAVLMAKRSQDSTAYPVAVTQSGSEVAWLVTNADVQYKGQGEAELFWFISDTQDGLAKTIVYSTWVADDIGEEGEVPEPFEPYFEQILNAVERIEAMGEELLALYTHTVYVDDNGDFYVNTDEGE